MQPPTPCASAVGEAVRSEFPLLARRRGDGRAFTYLDSAATALKPRAVIQAVTDAMALHTANVHRSVYDIGDEATAIYEGARGTVARFINAEPHEVVFVRNATEALNVVARAWPRSGCTVTSLGEHHSNLLPWGADLVRIRPLPDGTLDYAELERVLATRKTAVVALSHASNVTGTALDAPRVAAMAHAAGAVFVLDGAQSVPHRPVDVRALGCDFLSFSGHKMCAPTGIGVLYGTAEHFARMAWHLHGGATVEQVHLDHVVPKPPPWRFEAGTPPIEAAAGLAAAVVFLRSLGMDAVAAHDHELTQYALRVVRERVPRARVFGPADASRCGPVSLQLDGISPHVVARGLSDGYGICVRSGYHCAQPLHLVLNAPPTLRASFYLYNTHAEVDLFGQALAELLSFHESGIL